LKYHYFYRFFTYSVKRELGRKSLYFGLKRRTSRDDAAVQILVVVANIQTRTLKTEVEKGSM